MGFTRMTEDVLNVSKLADRVEGQASTLKQTFDRAGADLKTFINALITELENREASASLGANIEGVEVKTIQAVLEMFNVALSNRYTKTETNALIGEESNNLVQDVNVDLTTGVIKITKKDGSVTSFDTALEKVPASFELVEEANTVYLKITNVDGTFTQTNVTELMQEYEFNNSNEIAFSVDTEGYTKIVVASIRDNSIGLNKLTVEALSTFEGYVTSAQTSAKNAQMSYENARASELNVKQSESNASLSEQNASIHQDNAQTYSEQAKGYSNSASTSANTSNAKALEAKSYAVGGTGTRSGEDTDNAKYYMEIAKNLVAGFGEVVSINGKTGVVTLTTDDIPEGAKKYYTSADQTKLAGIENGAQANTIETVKVNNTTLEATNKSVNIKVPTKNSDLVNDSGYVASTDVGNMKVLTEEEYTALTEYGANTLYLIPDTE